MKNNRIAHICSAYPMTRIDRRPDRVEISPEQLSAAAIEAEVGLTGVALSRLSPDAAVSTSDWQVLCIKTSKCWAGTTATHTSPSGLHTSVSFSSHVT